MVYDEIRRARPISRSEISRQVGLSKPTVSLALQTLLAWNLVREAGILRGRPGPGAVLFEPNAGAAHVLALDIGASAVRGALADLDGFILARADVELGGAHVENVLTAVLALRDQLVGEGAVPAIDTVVAGAPGVVDPATGLTHLAHTVWGLEGFALGAALCECFDAHVIVENDVNLAALGEQTSGLGRGVRDFAAIEIGAGFGAGLVLDGNLHRGARGSAGELDYIPFSAAGAPAPLDPSLGGLGRLAAACGLGSDLPSVFAAARAGDRTALTVVEAEARVLALHLAAIAAVIDVELIVLGGAVTRAHGDLIVEPTRAFLAELVPIPPRVECSQLGEQAIVAGGIAVGASVALERVFSSRAAPKQRVTA